MNHLRKYVASACTVTTVITLFFYLITAIIQRSEGNTARLAIPAEQFFLILLFGLLIAGANLLLRLRRLALIWRLLLHYAAILVSFLVIFGLFGNLNLDSPAAVFVATIVTALLYAAAAALTLGTLRLLGRRERAESDAKKNAEYRSRYR